MRAEGFVLPELFARPRVQFRARAQQARTEATRRVASLRTARPGLRPVRIMPSVGRLGALFAKPDAHDATNTQTPSRSTEPANRLTKPTKNRASAHAGVEPPASRSGPTKSWHVRCPSTCRHASERTHNHLPRGGSALRRGPFRRRPRARHGRARTVSRGGARVARDGAAVRIEERRPSNRRGGGV